MRADDFHVLTRRVRLTGTITTVTGLRVGAGKGGDAMDLPILRDVDGLPFLPGASIKGVVRSTTEALIRGIGGPSDSTLWSCDPFSEKSCGFHKSGERENIRTDTHCTVCRLFGSHVVASHVRISDAMAVERGGAIPIELRDGVSIDRDLGTVHKGQKYDFQVVSPGTTFGLEVFADNVSDWQLGLLMTGFEQIAGGFSGLGGFTSRGLGRVDLKWSEVVDFAPRDLLGGIEARKKALAPAPVNEERYDGWLDALARHAGGES